MDKKDIAGDLLKAMCETFQASEAAGLDAHEAWEKAIVRLKARAMWLAKTHGQTRVALAMKVVLELFKKDEKYTRAKEA